MGAFAEEITNGVDVSEVTIAVNKDWAEGMASSIRCGVETLKKEEDIEAVIIMICDQPGITVSVLTTLIETWRMTGKPVVVSEYDGITGPPALFERVIFDELLQLKGDSGARKIVEKDKSRIAAISFPAGKTDIDTAADYAALLQTRSQHDH
jgi:molybdenum cofactor cytidylyltransferase